MSFMPLRATLSLVTPSTRKATDSPKLAFTSSRVREVSSMTSCRTPATIVSSSMPHSSKILATANG